MRKVHSLKKGEAVLRGSCKIRDRRCKRLQKSLAGQKAALRTAAEAVRSSAPFSC